MVIAIGYLNLEMFLHDAFTDGPRCAKVQRGIIERSNFTCGNQLCGDGSVIGGIDPEAMLKNIGFSGEVEIGMIGQINNCRGIALCLVMYLYFVVMCKQIAYLYTKVAGVGLVSGGACMGKLYPNSDVCSMNAALP